MASSITEAQAALIRYALLQDRFHSSSLTGDSSLTPDDIPHKLRCANCSKLAVNAFRLPCCEQAICESCEYLEPSLTRDDETNSSGHSSLPSSCPVCEHSPLSADDCTPNKSLRTTIKVFLRTAEKKREASKPKDMPEPAPETPVEATPVQKSDDGQVGADREATNGAQPLSAAAVDSSTGPAPDVVQGDTEASVNHDSPL